MHRNRAGWRAKERKGHALQLRRLAADAVEWEPARSLSLPGSAGRALDLLLAPTVLDVPAISELACQIGTG
jgi:hypothetical protein